MAGRVVPLACSVAAFQKPAGGFAMPQSQPDDQPEIPLPVCKELRRLAHDLSNSIETIMQANYLLSQATVSEADRKWLDLIEQATREAAEINRNIREILRVHSPRV
jgi:hypothetical protein